MTITWLKPDIYRLFAAYSASCAKHAGPIPQTTFSVCWGANAYGPGYDAANQTAYLDSMLRWSLDWQMNVSPA
jgi:hypothetical protein